MKRLEALAAAREAKVAEDAAAHAGQLQAQVEELKRTLASVGEFRERQVEVEEELLRAKEENQELREKLEAQRAELERGGRVVLRVMGKGRQTTARHSQPG